MFGWAAHKRHGASRRCFDALRDESVRIPSPATEAALQLTVGSKVESWGILGWKCAARATCDGNEERGECWWPWVDSELVVCFFRSSRGRSMELISFGRNKRFPLTALNVIQDRRRKVFHGGHNLVHSACAESNLSSD